MADSLDNSQLGTGRSAMTKTFFVTAAMARAQTLRHSG